MGLRGVRLWGFAVSAFVVRVQGVGLQWVQFPSGNWVAPAGSYRSGGGGDKTVGAFETNASLWRCSEPTGRNVSERRAGLEMTNVDADPATKRGRPPSLGMNGEAGIGRTTSDQEPSGPPG